MPQVTVVVPIYQIEQYLNKCVDSILAQTFTDFELILVDDGSPDRCGELCDRYADADPRVRVIHKENGGLSSARNAGIEAACGSYILFIDGDDYVDPDLLADMMQAMSREQADIVTVNARSGSEEHIEKEAVMPINDGTVDFPVLDYDALLSIYGKQISIFAWNNLYRMDIITRYSLRFEPTQEVLSEDQLFNFCYYAAVRKGVYIARPHYTYRVRTDSLSHVKKPANILTRRITLVRCLERFLRDHAFPRQPQSMFATIMWLFFADGCSALGSPAAVVEGLLQITGDNKRAFRRWLLCMLCGRAGRNYVQKYHLSFRQALFFRYMICLLLLGQYQKPASAFLAGKE